MDDAISILHDARYAHEPFAHNSHLVLVVEFRGDDHV